MAENAKLAVVTAVEEIKMAKCPFVAKYKIRKIKARIIKLKKPFNDLHDELWWVGPGHKRRLGTHPLVASLVWVDNRLLSTWSLGG